MALMGRIIMLPIPTVAAVNGHAFGAGFMTALCHDVRMMRADRGFLCANEMQLGMVIPRPELALFRHKLPAHVFFETVQLARKDRGNRNFRLSALATDGRRRVDAPISGGRGVSGHRCESGRRERGTCPGTRTSAVRYPSSPAPSPAR